MRSRGTWWLAAMTVAACTSSNPEGSPAVDAGADVGVDASDGAQSDDAGDGASDGPDASDAPVAPDGGFLCEASVDDYCASASCVKTWPSDPTDWCPFVTQYGISVAQCGQYELARDQGVDIAFYSYFDATTGALVAIIRYWWDGSVRCVAGPPEFVPPTACGTGSVVDCSDAAAPDAGAFDASDAAPE